MNKNCPGMFEINRKAVGQILTTIPVLLFVVLIMIVFVVLASFVGKVSGVDDVSPNLFGEEVIVGSNIDSHVLLELFLGDFVILDEKKVKVEDILISIMNSDMEKADELRGLVDSKFEEKYSCGGENVFYYYEFIDFEIYRTGDDSKTYYFETLENSGEKYILSIGGDIRC